MRSFFAEGTVKTADGETLTLVCDFWTCQIAEDVSGENWDDLIPKIMTSRSVAAIVLYSLLRKRHETVTLDQALGLFFDLNSAAIWKVAGEVIGKACNFEQVEEKPAKKKPSGRSRSSESNG